MKIVIVGGVAGGATAAARLRRISEKFEIILFEKDEYISYANCGLPYYIGGVITDKDKLQVQTVEGMSARLNIDIRIKSEVISIDSKNKTVTVKNGERQYEESYDKLILSCGARPIKPNIKGLDSAKNVFTLRNIPDTYKIDEYIKQNDIKTACVIGGGFIGVEMAENLAHANLKVTLVEKYKQILRPFDFEMAQILHGEMQSNNVNLMLDCGVVEFKNAGKTIVLDNNQELESDITILCVGITPESALAKQANIDVSETAHIKTDDNFNVYVDGKLNGDIFAVGDMIEVTNPLDDSKYSVPLAWGANRQGRLVADVIGGMKIKKSKILAASVLKVFSLTAASVGSNETMLKEKGIDFTSIHAHRANHATYYPGASNIALKLIYDKTSGRIYGAQAIGKDGTEKRIDVISTVMRLGGTVFDLSDLELCYAPPYSSAKDPVNILGYIAENVSKGAYNLVHHDSIDEKIKNGWLLIDVRTPFEFNSGHIDGAVNLELDSLRENLSKIEIAKNAPIAVNCQVGLRAYLAINILKDYGFTNLYNLSGGYLTYKNYKNAQIKSRRIEEVNDMQYKSQSTDNIKVVDCVGMQCPGPLMAAYKAVSDIETGEKINIKSSDFGFLSDIDNWAQTNGHKIISTNAQNGEYSAILEKGTFSEQTSKVNQKNATIVVFSGKLDKVLAAMIIAQGAAAQGKDVTMFYTFWGLNALRKNKKIKVKKNATEKMFGAMMPRGAQKLQLSDMNMFGIGSRMIKRIMKKKNVNSLPEMIENAINAGVKMVACTMSMDLMGIKKEELIEGIDYAGVATYISKNENVGTTLFI